MDNASSDGAPEMVAAEFLEVVLLRNDRNLGFFRANNQAALASSGELFFFSDNDTVVPAQTLGKLVQFLDAHPEVCLVGPKLRDRATAQVQMSYRRRPTVAVWLHRTWLLHGRVSFGLIITVIAVEDHEASRAQKVEVLMGAALFMSREKLAELGGWDEAFHFGGEDLELCWRAEKLGGAVYVPDIEITHLGRASTGSIWRSRR